MRECYKAGLKQGDAGSKVTSPLGPVKKKKVLKLQATFCTLLRINIHFSPQVHVDGRWERT